MKLKKIKISGFKSVKGEQTLLIDEKITIFIGANDHGKTNLLEAILRLNDDRPITNEDKNLDMPANSEVGINWYFDLTEEELQSLSDLQTKKESSDIPAKESNPEGLEPTTRETPGTGTGAPPLTEITAGEPAKARFIPSNSDKQVVFSRTGISKPVTVASVPFPEISETNSATILNLRPKVELFKLPSTNLVDSVSQAELDTSNFEFMQGIFRLAGLWDSRAELFTISTRTTRLLNEASQNLTKILNDQWNQGKNLEWIIKHTGNNGDHIEINIKDPAIDHDYSKPSLRSSGFQTYFLLSMITSARTALSKNNSYIFLFDEPGIYLHPRAQLDLQRSLEVISDVTQLVYTTHSLFLISKNHPQRNRVISKTTKGTIIDQKPFLNNWKSVRESLGILLSNNFLIADKTLLVEAHRT